MVSQLFSAILLAFLVGQGSLWAEVPESTPQKLIQDYYARFRVALEEQKEIPKPLNKYEWYAFFRILKEDRPEIRALLDFRGVSELGEEWLKEPGNEGQKILDRAQKLEKSPDGPFWQILGPAAAPAILYFIHHYSQKWEPDYRGLQRYLSNSCDRLFARVPGSLRIQMTPSSAPDFFPEEAVIARNSDKRWVETKKPSLLRAMVEEFPEGTKPLAVYLTERGVYGLPGSVFRISADRLEKWDDEKKKWELVTVDIDTIEVIETFSFMLLDAKGWRLDFPGR